MMNPSQIAKIAQIASVLEVSGYPKPGNVHRTRDYDDMVFEDFIISGIVIGDVIREATTDVNCKNPQTGKYILKAVSETDKWIANNTNLGIVMMITPIAQAAALSNSFEEVRENIKVIMGNTTVDDACDLYDAINIADAGGMGEQDEYDVASENAKKELKTNNQTMYDVLAISASWDRLACEMTADMPVVFELGYPTYEKLLKNNSLNDACVKLFLTILANIPDTLISRKYGDKKAGEVSAQAGEVLDNFSLEKLKEFDDYLFKNNLNPGTTADLTAASIFVSYIKNNFE